MVELVGGGSVINGAYPVYFLYIMPNISVKKVELHILKTKEYAEDRSYPHSSLPLNHIF